MEMHSVQARKAVIALDADDQLSRPDTIQSNSSEVHPLQVQMRPCVP
jgi:hypothetical protein